MSKAGKHIYRPKYFRILYRRLAKKIWPGASLGDATIANAGKGKTYLEAIISEIIDNVKKLIREEC